MDRGHAERFRSEHVGGRVINEQEFARPPPDTLEQDFVNFGVPLDEAHVAGDDAVIEFAQKIMFALGKRECFVSKIA